MKILIGIVVIYGVSYIPRLWSYRSEESAKTNKEYEIQYIDSVTTTDKTNISIANTTNATKTFLDHSIIKFNNSLKNTNKASVPKTGNSFEYTPPLDPFKNDTYFAMLNELTYVKKKLINFNCTRKYERYSLPEKCNEYIDCKNGTAIQLQCLNGLEFDPKHANTSMPCQYSTDVSCEKKEPIPLYSRVCPLQFGYFKIEDQYNCSSFRICEFGISYDFECPNGLAFRSDNLRCDWPHKVPECNAEAYAGFQCPNKSKSFDIIRSTNCQVYYTCIYGVPRRQSCKGLMGFDEDYNVCVPADRVEECDPELKLLAREERLLRIKNNDYSKDYDDGDGYLQDRNSELSFLRRVRKPKIISFPNPLS